MSNLRLAIFDCDGVLVDSEIIAAQVQSELLRAEGLEVDAKEFATRYAGLTWPVIFKKVEEEAGLRLSQDLRARVDEEIDRRLSTDVEEIAGVREAIAQIKLPRCICSNSSLARLQIELDHVGLWELFAPHIFPAGEVGTRKAKPEPDVFIHACEAFGVEPGEAIVIEDSVHGVMAASAAGCRVVGFTGGQHTYNGHADALTEAGAETVVSRFADLPATIRALSEWREG